MSPSLYLVVSHNHCIYFHALSFEYHSDLRCSSPYKLDAEIKGRDDKELEETLKRAGSRSAQGLELTPYFCLLTLTVTAM